ncbi:hypothetical protein [Algoriphagus sp.]|uniref:hypothetical protein n=1 Tax=Algoriphagus sp. TaxID=1872435 RepID=UPI00391B3CF8
MKRISPFFFCLLLLFSCGKGRKEVSNPNPIIASAPSGSIFTDTSEKSATQNSKGLEAQIPMSNDKLSDWIPQKVGEMEQRKLIIGHKQGMGMSGAIATYHGTEQDDKQISFEVLDGAGATGSVMLKSINQKLNLDYNEKMSSGYSRIYDREGIRVWEKLNTEEHLSEIEFVMDKRYHFIFKGHGIEMKELWAFVRQVRIEMS